jgi:hypothetical protein
MLNDVQVVEAARFVGQRMLKEGGASLSEQIDRVFHAITSRRPSARELPILERLYLEQREFFQKEASAAQKLVAFGEAKTDPVLTPADLAAATTLALALFNHDDALMRR